MVTKSIITGKNQVMIPARLARQLNIGPGTELEWEIGEDGTLIIRALLPKHEIARQLEGMLNHVLQPGDDPIADLIRDRELEDQEID